MLIMCHTETEFNLQCQTIHFYCYNYFYSALNVSQDMVSVLFSLKITITVKHHKTCKYNVANCARERPVKFTLA